MEFVSRLASQRKRPESKCNHAHRKNERTVQHKFVTAFSVHDSLLYLVFVESVLNLSQRAADVPQFPPRAVFVQHRHFEKTAFNRHREYQFASILRRQLRLAEHDWRDVRHLSTVSIVRDSMIRNKSYGCRFLARSAMPNTVPRVVVAKNDVHAPSICRSTLHVTVVVISPVDSTLIRTCLSFYSTTVSVIIICHSLTSLIGWFTIHSQHSWLTEP